MKRFTAPCSPTPLFAAVIAAGLFVGCESGGIAGGQQDGSCDDGDPVVCAMMEPHCASGTITAIQDGCWICVDPGTCAPPSSGSTCTEDRDCDATQWCSPCGASSCPTCTDCVAVCQVHGCPTEAEAQCEMVRPDCDPYGFAVVQDGCWVCVTPNSCSPVRDPVCDDGTEPLCNMIPPECDPSEILAHQNQCYACVNPDTCAPWGEATCRTDADCAPEDRCDACASSSCPGCEDCVAACLPHGCATEPEAQCYMMRPNCDANEVAVVDTGCWVCVDLDTCP